METRKEIAEFDGYIDMGKELSLLHSLLVESLEKMNEVPTKVGQLKQILDELVEAERDPQGTLQRQKEAERDPQDMVQRHKEAERDPQGTVQRQKASEYDPQGTVQRQKASERDPQGTVQRQKEAERDPQDIVQRHKDAEHDPQGTVQRQKASEHDPQDTVQRQKEAEHDPQGTVQRHKEAERDPQGTVQRHKEANMANSVTHYDNVSLIRSPLNGVSNTIAHRTSSTQRNYNEGHSRPNTLRNYNDGHSKPNTLRNYNDANLSRSQDFAVFSNSPTNSSSDLHYGAGSHQGPTGSLSTADDYVMFSARSNSARSRVANHERPNEREVNQSWNRIVTAAEMVNGDYVDLVSFVDEERQGSSIDLDNSSQISIGQLSTVGSSGYQSFGYSQSSSPVDAVSQDMVIPTVQPLSFSNPLYTHQPHQTQTAAPPTGITRILSSSSLSSDEGSASLVRCSSHHNQFRHHSPPPHEHTPRKPSNLSISSSSSESLKCHSPTHAHHSSGHGAKLVHSRSVSGNTNLGSPMENRPLAINILSKSAEFSPRKSQIETGMKRTVTDSTISQSASHSEHAQLSCNARRSMLPQNTVRMGVRSVQRHLQEQKSKDEVGTQSPMQI